MRDTVAMMMPPLPLPEDALTPDEASEMSFPASDPPSHSQPTIGDGDLVVDDEEEDEEDDESPRQPTDEEPHDKPA